MTETTNPTWLEKCQAYEKALKASAKAWKEYNMGLVAGTADSSSPPPPPPPPPNN